MDYKEGYNYYDKKEKEYDKKEKEYDKKEKEKECECKKEKDYEDYHEKKEELQIPCHEGGKVFFPPCTICGNEDVEAAGIDRVIGGAGGVSWLISRPRKKLIAPTTAEPQFSMAA